MRAKILAPAFVLIGLLTWSLDARAQDEVPGPDLINTVNTLDPSVYEEKPLLIESDGRTTKSMLNDSSNVRTPAVVPARKTTPAEAKKKEETDPLNFNFLFYIIQTFKSSDLMEN